MVYLFRTDADGTLLWQKIFGGSGFDFGHCVRQTADGGYIVVGKTDSFGGGDDDIYVIKTHANGDEAWSMTIP
jgi:hypothetical protein